MRGYLNLLILGYLPGLILDKLIDYFNPMLAVIISLTIILPFIFKAIKQQDYICLIFVSGFLANNERNNVICSNAIGWSNMKRLPNIQHWRKYEPLLEISYQYTDKKNDEIIVLKPKNANKLLPIKVLDLVNNNVLLSALSQKDALSIGYSASNIFLKGR